MESTSQTATFCDELRKAREFQGLSLDDIVKKTRISKDYLIALEKGRLEVIPASIRRGVVSAYAQSAGMNADKVLKTLEGLQGAKPVVKSGSMSSKQSGSKGLTVGMTRAQIRTAWFASIAGNTFLHWSLTVLALLVGLVIAAQWREIGPDPTGMPPASGIVSDPISSFRFDWVLDLWEVPPDSSKPSSLRTDHETSLICYDTCFASISWGIEPGPRVLLYPHDKTILRHNSGVRVGVDPGFAGILISKQDTFIARFTKDSSACWLSFPDIAKEVKVDSSSIADSARG